MFAEGDARDWAVQDDLVVCPNCLAPADVDRGLIASSTQTAVLRIAASHAAALDGALSLFEDYVQRGDSAAVLFYLRSPPAISGIAPSR